jgi:hypothetical protein
MLQPVTSRKVRSTGVSLRGFLGIHPSTTQPTKWYTGERRRKKRDRESGGLAGTIFPGLRFKSVPVETHLYVWPSKMIDAKAGTGVPMREIAA